MPLLRTIVVVKCPSQQKDVNVKETCLAGCSHFMHLSYVSGLPLVSCIHPTDKTKALTQAEVTGKPIGEITRQASRGSSYRFISQFLCWLGTAFLHCLNQFYTIHR